MVVVISIDLAEIPFIRTLPASTETNEKSISPNTSPTPPNPTDLRISNPHEVWLRDGWLIEAGMVKAINDTEKDP